MDAARSDADRSRQPVGVWGWVWPAGLGVLVAAATAFRLADGTDAAALVAASGFVYLAAAALGRRGAAWVAFGVTFALITVQKLTAFDAVPWILLLAVIVFVVGLASRRLRPWWALPLQSAAMLVLAGIVFLSLRVDVTIGGLLVALALFAHAAWDITHLRLNRVVGRSLAEFCAVLDVLVGVLVAVIAIRG